jgi:hypothetical protein
VGQGRLYRRCVAKVVRWFAARLQIRGVVA